MGAATRQEVGEAPEPCSEHYDCGKCSAFDRYWSARARQDHAKERAELLEALEVLANRVDPGVRDRDFGIKSLADALRRARAAIAKARGES